MLSLAFSSVLLGGDLELRNFLIGIDYKFTFLAVILRLSIGQFMIYISCIFMFWYPPRFKLWDCSPGNFFDEVLITLCILKPPEVFVGLYSSANTPDMLIVFKS